MWRWFITLGLASVLTATPCRASDVVVDPHGRDDNAGSIDAPLRSLGAAQRVARALAGSASGRESVQVVIRAGVYSLREPLVLTGEDSGTARNPVRYVGEPGAVLTGAERLNLEWVAGERGVWSAKVPDDVGAMDQLFINGRRMPMARYPNEDSSVAIFNGYARDAIDVARTKGWKDPAGAFVHAIHKSRWGSLEYRVTGREPDGSLTLEGGWQSNRPALMHPEFRFVENVREELDAPGEWFFDRRNHALLVMPPAGVDLKSATVEAVGGIESLIEFRGSTEKPVQWVSVEGLTLTGTARTFMKTREPILRSDWRIYRGGAVVFRGAENCAIRNCTLDQVGGNAVFIDGHNRRIAVEGCEVARAGASGVCVVGQASAVRDGLTEYGAAPPANGDETPGPREEAYPRECRVSDCLVHDIGRVEKQVAGVEIDIASEVTVSHCTIYGVPRAGLNIGDGCFGGHVIEHCDVFDTVLETGDHGAFNVWGRDRYWVRDRKVINAHVAANPELPFLDAREPNVIRDSRWRCDHGWDIDLDDGASNYLIYDNLLLNGGLKLREGYRRIVWNNLLPWSTLHPHVWLERSGDVFAGNVVGAAYKPVGMPQGKWGERVDWNLFLSDAALNAAKALGGDASSVEGSEAFVNAPAGDFRLEEKAGAGRVGFVNFPMNDFGVVSPRLKALARKPAFSPGTGVVTWGEAADRSTGWLGARVKPVTTEGEMSAAGLAEKSGVLVLDVPTASAAARVGLQKTDVIVEIDGRRVRGVSDLNEGRVMKVVRNQGEMEISIR